MITTKNRSGKTIELTQVQSDMREAIKNIPYRNVADRAGVSYSALSAYINGRSNPCKFVTDVIMNTIKIIREERSKLPISIKTKNYVGREISLSPNQYKVRMLIEQCNHNKETIAETSGVALNTLSRWTAGLNEPTDYLLASVIEAIKQLANIPRVKLRNCRSDIYALKQSGLTYKEIAARYKRPEGSIASAYRTHALSLN
jgi:hypothetical protein